MSRAGVGNWSQHNMFNGCVFKVLRHPRMLIDTHTLFFFNLFFKEGF